MKSAFRFVLLCSFLLALPLIAQPIEPPCPGPERCDDPPPYEPQYLNCVNRSYTGINFLRQKPNGKCIYRCFFTERCFDVLCDTDDFIDVLNGTHRVRLDPEPSGGCRTPSLDICTEGELIAEGEPD